MKSVTLLVTGSSDTSLVVAPGAGKVIRILGVAVSTLTAINVSLYSATSASGALLSTVYLPATTTVVMPIDTEGWCDTAQNEALIFKGSTTGNTTITVRYVIIG